jgi:thiamine pyrophosphokinase
MQTIILANGDMAGTDVVHRYTESAELIVCADGGANYADAVDVRPDVLIGDMDSITPELRARLEMQGVKFILYPRNKDETDLELALLYAVEQGATQITILGALGRRIDHELGNLLLLAHPRLEGLDIRIASSEQEISLIRKTRTFDGAIGDLLSLLPIGGDAVGIITEGLEYPLCDETLFFGPARGVSNVFTMARPSVHIRSGLLLAVHTHLR